MFQAERTYVCRSLSSQRVVKGHSTRQYNLNLDPLVGAAPDLKWPPTPRCATLIDGRDEGTALALRLMGSLSSSPSVAPHHGDFVSGIEMASEEGGSEKEERCAMNALLSFAPESGWC